MRTFLFSWAAFAVIVLSACRGGLPPDKEALHRKLIDAVLHGQLAVVDSCLKAGADPNCRDGQGTPAIILAIHSPEPGVARALLEGGASPNAVRPDYYGSTALMEAAVRNDTLLGALLLNAGAEVNLRDTLGDPAINWAAYYGHVAYTRLLMRHGARWDADSPNGSAVDIAARRWHLGLLDFFLSQVPGQDNGNGKDRALFRALRQGQFDTMRRLLQAGADPDYRDELGSPLLWTAAAGGQVAAVDLLLHAGARPDATNRTGYSPLAAAARFGQLEIAGLLVDAGAGINTAGEPYRITPLMCAAMGGQVEMGLFLIDRGALIDQQDDFKGYTALMYATEYGQEAFLQLLIRYRANPYIKSKEGIGLYELVSFSANPKIGRLIENYVLGRQ